MKTFWGWILCIIVAIVIVGGAIYTMTQPKAEAPAGDKVQLERDASAGNTKKACEIFTPKVAKDILGASAKKSEVASSDNQSSTENIIVSNCGYEAGTTLANILVRGAKRQEAYSTNIFGFDSTRTQGMDDKKAKSVTISGLGDQAFYNPDFKQVNVLVNKGQYWLIVQVGQDKQLAERVARAVVKGLR